MSGSRLRIGDMTKLLAGVSIGAVMLCLTSAPASAQLAAMRAAAGTVMAPTVVAAPVGTPARSATMQDALARQQALQSRAQALQAYVASAHSAALSAITGTPTDGVSDKGLNPIQAVRAATIYVQSGTDPTTVAGAKVPDAVAAVNDATGLATWEGAKAPVQSTGSDGHVTVRIDQTQQRALLSWRNLDVSANTTLTFNQQGQQSWTVVNRVANSVAPSKILGTLKADGTVLILNSAGVLFGPGAQVNLHSLVVSSLDLGNFASSVTAVGQNQFFVASSIKDRNTAFLQNGLLVQGVAGYKGQILSSVLPTGQYDVNQALPASVTAEGDVLVYSGASITSDSGGYIILAAPTVINAGSLSATDGQVSLQAGRFIGATTSTGATGSADPNVRGLVLSSQTPTLPQSPEAPTPDQGTVINYGSIRSRRGYISLGAAPEGTVDNAGLLSATTSVSRNGKIALSGGTVTLSGSSDPAQASGIVILPDDDGETIPQGSPDSPPAFKTSQITIGDSFTSYLTTDTSGDIGLLPSVFSMESNAFIFAPSANVVIGHNVAAGSFVAQPGIPASVTIADGATIDVSGMKAVERSASVNSVEISPAKQNELRDTPNYRAVSTDGSFTLNGETLYVDARTSGVRSDGVAWVGSPLLEAASAISQIPVTAADLMTKGGAISIDVGPVVGSTNLAANSVAAVSIAKGAVFDISGGWTTYSAGTVLTSQLLTADGRVVDIADADPNDDYVEVVNGFTAIQPHFGISEVYTNAALKGLKYQDAYDEGRDAGALEIAGSQIGFDGTIHADAFAGSAQIASAIAPTATSAIAGDPRKLQYTQYQLPTGGLFRIGSFSGSSSIGLGQDIAVHSGTRGTVDDPATLLLDDGMLSSAGLSALLLQTSGAVAFASATDSASLDANMAQMMANSDLTLADGGVLEVDAGRDIRFDGTVRIAGGKIAARTYQLTNATAAGIATVGNPFRADDDIALDYTTGSALPDPFDIIVNGTLSVAGKWTNDYLDAGTSRGAAWINGGSISLTVAPKVFVPLDGTLLTASVAGDLSGSIRINKGALLDVSSGGYVSNRRRLTLSATGGNVSLIDQTTYASVALLNNTAEQAGATEIGQSVAFTPLPATATTIGVLPALVPVAQNSVVSIAPGTMTGFGFGGGGKFTLVSPDVAVGGGGDAQATTIGLDFLQSTGFGALDITSYHARAVSNLFDNGGTGLSSFFDTTRFTIGAGQQLDLTQRVLPSVLDTATQTMLLNLSSGTNVASLLTPATPTSAWYQKAASLALHGLMELDVDAGGSIVGAAQASIVTPKLYNAGSITIAGGSIQEIATLPEALNGRGIGLTDAATGGAGFTAVFGTPDAKGHYGLGAANTAGLLNADGSVQTNGQIFTTPGNEHFLYFLGRLGADDGIVLAKGSVVDLAGAAIYNPNAPLRQGGTQYQFGKLIAGGSITTASPLDPSGDATQALFANPAYGFSSYPDPTSTSPTPPPLLAQTAARQFLADAGSTIDISGASGMFDIPVSATDYASSLQWSDAGTIALRAGGTLDGATINAHGGASAATGGTLEWYKPVVRASDDGSRSGNAANADQIAGAGFDTLIADGGLTLDGAFTLSLRKALLVRSPQSIDGTPIGANAAISVSATAGTDATIAAPYISFSSRTGTVPSSAIASGNGVVTFAAGASGMDVEGSVLFDSSIGQTNLTSQSDVRLIGVDDRSDLTQVAVLDGSLVSAGNLTFDAARVYTTTGTGNLQRILEDEAGATDTRPPSPFVLSALGASTITFLGTHINKATPLSAGSDLEIRADNVVQDGFVAAPLGRIAFGTADSPINGISFGANSVTLVSGAGLSVPYGTTTDQTQVFFTPGTSSPLTSLPSGALGIVANTIDVASGATVAGAGGGSVFAYEFVSGTGGSRDVLSRFNTDAFSSNGYNPATGVGYQYADARQVYALVPTAVASNIALMDPVYSDDYGASGPTDLYGTGAGLAVTLDGGAGIAAGQYVLMPAHYALLPGAYRIVENVGAVAPASSAVSTLRDGSIVIGGTYSTAGTDLASSQRRSFTIESQAAFSKYSTIKTTADADVVTAAATSAGITVPRLPLDAARVTLDPLKALNVNGAFDLAPATGGRGSEVDILGTDITVAATDAVDTTGLVLSNATLANLGANSLMIGGARIDNADGTTRLGITANKIAILGGADIELPEVILAVAGAGSTISVRDGAVIKASGTLADTRSGDYVITSDSAGSDGFDESGVGSVLRLSNGTQRLVDRQGDVAAANAGRNSRVSVGKADLAGNSLLLDSNRAFAISAEATLAVPNVALSAANIAFGEDGTINGALEAKLASVANLELASPSAITFDPGSTHTFHNITVDAPGIALSRPVGEQATVTISAGDVRLANDSRTTAAGCTISGATLCGTTGNTLAISGASLTLGSGDFNLYSFDGAVTLAATNGVYVEGKGALQANGAALAIATPFIIDRAAVVDPNSVSPAASDAITPAGNYTIPVTPDYGFLTSGAVTLSRPNGASSAAPAGIRAPGARIAFGSGSAPLAAMTIDGVALTATSGVIDVESTGSITLAGAASLSTPGYSRSFGDAQSTTTISAGAGTVNLVSLSGDIILPSTSTVTVDTGVGNAGQLNLLAADGAITFDAALDPLAKGARAASLDFDAGKSAFDLSRFVTQHGSQFQGAIAIRSGLGDLTLASGQVLKSSGVTLTADGGNIAISGMIDTSGVNVAGLSASDLTSARVSGGDVSLWGRDGVLLQSGSLIDTHTTGYADTDQRQASAGNVTLGIGDSGGAIVFADGATIDLGARRTLAAQAAGQSGNRLVPTTVKDPDTLVDKTVYQFVAADTGGTLSLRAPVTGDNDTLVDVRLHGKVVGAQSTEIVGYKTYDLDQIAADGLYDGVFHSGRMVYLDPTPSGFNILSDVFRDDTQEDDAGNPVVTESVPYFIQNFAVSAADGSNLAGMRLRPGVDLVAKGGVAFLANWNLAAGTLDVDRANAAGLLQPLPELGLRPTDGTPYYAIKPGQEATVLADYVSFLYRVGGSASGEAGVFTIKAGGTLDIPHSISDGFFTFADKSDAAYINYQLGGGTRTYDLALQVKCGTGLDCGDIASFADVQSGAQTADASNTVTIDVSHFLTGKQQSAANVLAPYDPEANSAIALGNNTDPLTGDIGGDALGFAQLFPLLPDGTAIHSSSLRLVGGAGATASVNPLHVDRAAKGDVVVEGESGYMLTAESGGAILGSDLDLKLAETGVTSANYPTYGLGELIGTTNTTSDAAALKDDSYTSISWGIDSTGEAADLRQAAMAFFADRDASFAVNTRQVTTGVSARLSDMIAFLQSVAPDFVQNVAHHVHGYPNGQLITPPVINFGTHAAYSRTLVRTGDGTISVAAAGNVDLRNGATATYRNENNGTVSATGAGAAQVGGTAIYTAGTRVSSAAVSATIVGTTTSVSVAPDGGYLTFPTQDVSFLPSPKGLDDEAGVLAHGGGAVSISAGGDVLGRRDVWSERYLGRGGLYNGSAVTSFVDTEIGDASQRWRPGSVGQDTEIAIAPKYFTSGVGALAGGDVTITAGGAVSDLTVALDAATTTTTLVTTADGKDIGAVAMTLGHGDLAMRTGGDLQAGQIDVADGAARIDVGGGVVAFGNQPNSTSIDTSQYLRVRVSEANVALTAGGSIALAGVSALGAARGDSSLDEYYQAGFFKPEASFSAVATGSLDYVDNRLEQTVPFQVGAGNAGVAGGGVLPPTLTLAALTDSLSMPTLPLLLYPSKIGNLELFSGGDISSLVIAMSDSDPSLLPGQFSAAQISLDSINATGGGNVTAAVGLGFGIPGAQPTSSDKLLRLYHNQNITHAGDADPIRIYAGNDIRLSLINVPKVAQITAGRDIQNLFFTGQNANATDTTIISAGRDLTATTASSATSNLPYVVSGDIVLGGPGSLIVEAGRNIGPFINSAVVKNISYAGGIQTVGNLYNPWLGAQGADLSVLFGIGKGIDYTALRDTYLDPTAFDQLDGDLFVTVTDALGNSHPDRSRQIYAPILAKWLRDTDGDAFAAIFGTTSYPDTDAGNAALANAAYGKSADLYKAFVATGTLLQDKFLVQQLLFNELRQPAEPTGPSYLQYIRGYRAIQTLFPASLGYTDNLAPYTTDPATISVDHPQGVPTRKLVDGQPMKADTIETGNADLHLATLQTMSGGDLTILGPGGDFSAGSVVRTSAQVAGRVTRFGVDPTASLAFGQLTNANVQRISAIPIGYEGVLTLNGGAIDAFTDGSFLVNQSRVFSQAGGDITMWSSNGDLNAGQGPRSASNFPPISVRFDLDGYSRVDSAGSVSGAGIGAFQRSPTDPLSSVILVAPAGLVDAGDAGVRATGDVLVAAARVANADSFSAGGSISGVPSRAAAPAAVAPSSAASAIAAQANQSRQTGTDSDRRSIITVDVLGFAGAADCTDPNDPDCKKKE